MVKAKKENKTEENTGGEAQAKPKVESSPTKRRKRVLELAKELDAISCEYQAEAKVSPAGCIRIAVQRLNRLFKDDKQNF